MRLVLAFEETPEPLGSGDNLSFFDPVTDRKAVDPGYKANRPGETPLPIKSLPNVKRGLNAIGLPWIEIDTPDSTIKFELNEDIAHSICSRLEHFLTQELRGKLNQAQCSQ